MCFVSFSQKNLAVLPKISQIMKVLLAAGFLVAIALILFSCKTKKEATDPSKAPSITWGSGGGFTGKEVSFALTENGQIFKHEGLNAGQSLEMKAVKAKVAKAMFSSAKELNLSEIALNKPGNMYYFIEFPGAEKPIRITWGDGETEVPQKLKDFHRVLNQLVLKGTEK